MAAEYSRLMEGLIKRGQAGNGFASLWVDSKSYLRQLGKRIRLGDVDGAAEYEQRTLEVLASAGSLVVVTPLDCAMRQTGKMALASGSCVVLLTDDGRLVTSYPYRFGATQFEERHKALGDEVNAYPITAEHQLRLARVFGPGR